MKKTICIIILIVVCFPLNAKKWFDTNKNISFGLLYGTVCAKEELSQHAWGFNSMLYGFYFDLLIKGRSHGGDVAVGKWKDKEADSFHFGYQIPIIEYVRIVPIIGYSSVKTGMTDGYNWSISQHGLSNSFNVDKKIGGFDCGGVLVLNYSIISLYGGYTNYNMFYGGVGIELRF